MKRTEIAEDAKMSWYFEMLDDSGKQLGIVSDDSVTNSNSTTNETTSGEEDDESESENENESESENENESGGEECCRSFR